MKMCNDCGQSPAKLLEDKTDCHDCDAKPGEPHDDGCDMEMCTICGGQRMLCDCKKHNKKKAAWDGYFPGSKQAAEKGLCLNCVYKVLK